MIRLLILLMTFSSTQLFAYTYSVVTFNSEEGIIFIKGSSQDGAYEIFNNLAVDIVTPGGAIKKLYRSQDGLIKVACDGPLFCAFMIYPSNNTTLNFDTNSVEFKVSGEEVRKYADLFTGDFDYNHEGLIIKKTANELYIHFPGQILNGGNHL